MSDLQTCTQYFQAKQFPAGANDKGFRWGFGGVGLTSFNTVVPPNSKQYPWGGCRLDQAGGGFALGPLPERHQQPPRAAANVLYADGSVHFVKDSIAIENWWALGTRKGGEVLSADQY